MKSQTIVILEGRNYAEIDAAARAPKKLLRMGRCYRIEKYTWKIAQPKFRDF